MPVRIAHLVLLSLALVLAACARPPIVPADQQRTAASASSDTTIVAGAPTQTKMATLPAASPVPSATLTPVSPTATSTPTPPTPTPTPPGPLAPETLGQGGTWMNSEPLTLAELRGRVVLLQFWTYGCYNCQNTMPAVRDWWANYQDDGLVIIGVHTPELDWEYPLANVQQAITEEGITWPVVQDNDYQIWRSYRNRYWPRFYLIDHEGHIIYDKIGEGGYDGTEQRIVAALEAAGYTVDG